jgi:hypothetical protein
MLRESFVQPDQDRWPGIGSIIQLQFRVAAEIHHEYSADDMCPRFFHQLVLPRLRVLTEMQGHFSPEPQEIFERVSEVRAQIIKPLEKVLCEFKI